MTLLINSQDLSKSFGSQLLFKGLNFSLFSGDRVGLIGPNGSGKSTLLKILAGQERPTSGSFSTKKHLKIGYVPQTCDFEAKSPGALLVQALHERDLNEEEKTREAKAWLSRLGFRGDEPTADRLSGGWKKRLSLAEQLIVQPDLLLLDEPTNHLDLEGILWLEKFLIRESMTYLLVSHDRYFLQNMTNRIIEINHVYPEGLFALDGSYANFLEKKEAFLSGQLQQERALASKARHEQEWLRKSPKARTTKAQSRVDDAHEILEGLQAIKARNRTKTAGISFSATERETKKLLVAKNLSKSVGERLLFKHLDFTLSPGTRIGLMGPNGSGKTTLLKILVGEETQDLGTLKPADDLKIVYFDQHRHQLPDNMTLREALSPQGDFVNFRGQMIHVNGWCKRFLFSPDNLGRPLDKLSGGERARIAIAHLMLQPADILLLDEPTNDLDIATLEALEDNLADFPGAVILITHDRCMMERICNKFLAFGDPEAVAIYSDYSQWEKTVLKKGPETKEKEIRKESQQKTKLSYAEKKEYEQIEGKIGVLEKEVHSLNSRLSTEDPDELREICAQIGLAENRIEQLYLRFDELSKKERA